MLDRAPLAHAGRTAAQAAAAEHVASAGRRRARAYREPMAHDHAGHSHAVRADADRGRLRLALGLIVAFIAVEVAVGVIAHSLALLSDAGHMLTDAAAIGFSLLAIALAARPAKGAMTFGFKRVGDPLRAGQRRDAADPRGVHRLRGDPPPVRPAASCAAG